jgi:hypothetical protein
MLGRILSFSFFFFAAVCLAAAQPQADIRGKLVAREGQPPALEMAGNKLVVLDGEPETMAVLKDARLAGMDLEVLGQFKSADHFAVGPFYTSKSIIVHKDGKKYTISYWCPICSIRSYTPGKCVCCQQETHLDFQELTP